MLRHLDLGTTSANTFYSWRAVRWQVTGHRWTGDRWQVTCDRWNKKCFLLFRFCGIGAIIHSRWKIQCLPFAGFSLNWPPGGFSLVVTMSVCCVIAYYPEYGFLLYYMHQYVYLYIIACPDMTQACANWLLITDMWVSQKICPCLPSTALYWSHHFTALHYVLNYT